MTCSLCMRELDVKADPLSNDCGGDCLGCMIEVEQTESLAYTELEVAMRDRIVELERRMTLMAQELHPINHLADRVHLANKQWWVDLHTGEPIKRNVGELLMLTTSELAEAMEGDRKNLMDDKLPHRKMFEVELADAVIRILDIAGGMGLDLGGAFEEKMAYNAQRADHKVEHRKADGGKKY